MKKSKLTQFKLNELKLENQKNISAKVGGTSGAEETWNWCKEETSGGSDSLFEKWPDGGGEVWQTYVY